MNCVHPVLFAMLLPVPVIAQQEPRDPLLVGLTVQDAIVAPIAQFVEHEWRAIPEDSNGVPRLRLPFYWYQLTASGRSIAFTDIATVKVSDGMEDPSWTVGQLIAPESDSIRDKRLPFGGTVMVDSVLTGGIFVIDSSATTRTRVLSLLTRVFPDSLTRPVTGRSKYLPRGSAPVGRVTVQRLSPVGQGKAALMLVEAERCLIVAEPNDCGHTYLIDLWLLDHGGRYQVLSQRGPIHSNSDFKSGSGLSARAWLEIERRRFLLVECRSYMALYTSVFEALPTGVRQVYPSDLRC